MKKSTQKRRKAKQGSALFNEVVRLTGVPAKAMKRELHSLLEKKNIDVKNLTLDQLRIVAATYLKEIMGAALDADHRRTRH